MRFTHDVAMPALLPGVSRAEPECEAKGFRQNYICRRGGDGLCSGSKKAGGPALGCGRASTRPARSRGATMATYISLIKWTDQGIRNVKDVPKRIDASRELQRKHGAEMTAIYMTMGEYDVVSIVEAPDDETVAKILLALGSAGNVRTVTMKAFNEAELRQIIGSLG
jgi:uncharacterized protein with GYD domain